MIHIFDTSARIFFFPVRWANSVATWIQNIASPDDTIKVTNTCSPKEGSSLGLSVNMQRIYDGVKTYFEDFWITATKLREALDDACDGNSIEVNDGKYRVSESWLAERVNPPQMFDIVAVMTTPQSGTPTVDYVAVYLPSLNFKLWNEDYHLTISSATGYLTALADNPGWYKINGIKTGDIYLVDAAYKRSGSTEWSRRCAFATAALTDGRYSAKLANVAADGTVTLYSNTRAPAINMCGANMLEAVKNKSNDNFEENDGATGEGQPQDYELDTREWVRGETVHLEYSSDGNDKTVSTELFGVRCQVVTRVVNLGLAGIYLYWRYWYFDKYGMLWKISAEQGSFAARHY